MAELADALDSGSRELYACAGSSPVSRTIIYSVYGCPELKAQDFRRFQGILRPQMPVQNIIIFVDVIGHLSGIRCI